MEKHIRFDWAMKRLLRQKSNFGILEGFLSELLMQDIIILEILDSESNKLREDDKYNRVDILVKSTKDELMLVEVQNEKQHDYFHRMNYGQAKLISEHIDGGDSYEKIKKVFSINIVYFELGQGKDYIYTGTTQFKGVHNKDTLNLSSSQKKKYQNIKKVSDIFATYYIIKVNNFDDKALNTLDEWIYFLKNSEIKDEFKAKGLPEAKEKMRTDNLNKSDKYDYDAYVKEQRIKEAEITTAVFDARVAIENKLLPRIEQEKQRVEQEKQRAEQERKKMIATIKNMNSEGMSNELISKYTGEKIETIEKYLSSKQ
ncbi:MAG: Rpn family recombination-promoting nuclease/putative transposase [Bacteroidota bacterium]|nr:Rpn family recombination-promoting nuclease/putative transposase [Bacteroidota bacterium]